MDFQSFILSFTAMFVALDILGGVPIYIGMTKHLAPDVRQKTVRTSMLVATIVILIFWATGQKILQYLGITLFDFRIAGGLVLLLIALADLASGPEKTHIASGQTGIVPLAVPLITGPAALATIVIEVGARGYWIPLWATLANYGLAWVAFSQCDRIQRLMGKDGTVIVSKIAALFLAAIAISMIREGVFAAIRNFGAY